MVPKYQEILGLCQWVIESVLWCFKRVNVYTGPCVGSPHFRGFTSFGGSVPSVVDYWSVDGQTLLPHANVSC